MDVCRQEVDFCTQEVDVCAQVIAHEIAHSWTGNLVTNRTWEHFW